jgi:hypothetical protein
VLQTKIRAVAALTLAFGLGVFVLAPGSSAKSGSTASVKHIKVSGCVQPGDPPNDFSLKTNAGKVYGLSSSAVKLADHLGHQVTIAGELKPRVTKADYDFEGSEVQEYAVKNPGSALDIEVATLKMIGTSCPSAR